jgi:hypothetical protein
MHKGCLGGGGGGGGPGPGLEILKSEMLVTVAISLFTKNFSCDTRWIPSKYYYGKTFK